MLVWPDLAAFYYIVAVDISRGVDLAAAAAIWHLRGVNWYLERYYAITICVYVWTQRDGAGKLRYQQNCEHRQLAQC